MLIQMFLMRETMASVWGSCGHRPRLVITTQGIDLPTARLLILLLFPFQRQRLAHELCGHIDQLIESYCLEPWVIIEGGITQLLFCACVWASVLLSSLSQHILPLAHLRFAKATQMCTRLHTHAEHIQQPTQSTWPK